MGTLNLQTETSRRPSITAIASKDRKRNKIIVKQSSARHCVEHRETDGEYIKWDRSKEFRDDLATDETIKYEVLRFML